MNIQFTISTEIENKGLQLRITAERDGKLWQGAKNESDRLLY